MSVHRNGILVVLSLLLVSGCGGSSSSSSSSSSSGTSSGNSYSVGGTLTGLAEAGLLLGNGKDILTETTTASTFTFPTLVAAGDTYGVQVLQQPAGQTCFVADGSGTMGTAAVTNVAVTCGEWAWLSGADTANAAGDYGTLNILAATNVPGARTGAAAWTDSSHNFWLFGGDTNGGAQSGQFNDLWLYNYSAGQWDWVSGSSSPNAPASYGTRGTISAANVPGARFGAVTWIDSSNNLWLFGGESENLASGNVVQFNDLWMFDPLINGGEWTWVSGSSTPNAPGSYGTLGVGSAGNAPGARAGAVSWLDGAGNFWLFGGFCYSETNGTAGSCTGAFNDLWKFSQSSGQWTWVSGSDTAGAGAVYGTKGVAAAANVPSARAGAQAWIDKSGNLWLFGGTTVTQGSASSGTGDLNDLWSFSPSTGEWTWRGGSATPGAQSSYAAQGTASAASMPGARDSGTAWTDASGNFWLFGGQSTTDATTTYFGDLWLYQTGSGQWMYVSGATSVNATAVYGTELSPAVGNMPGGRSGAVPWLNGFSSPWLFGGAAVDSSGNITFLNDLWVYISATSPSQ